MSAFIDQEAEVSDNEDEEEGEVGGDGDDGGDGQPAKKKSKKINSDDSDEDDDEEEDDERQIAKEMAGFVVDGVESEGEGEDKASEKSKSDDEEEEIDEDDVALIQENLGIKTAKKKSRIVMDDSDDEGGDGAGAEPTDDRSRIARDIFEGDEDDENERESSRPPGSRAEHRGGSVRPEAEPARARSDSGSESEPDDWLVDEDGRSIRPKKMKRTGDGAMSNAQLEEAREIFGVDFDFDDFLADGAADFDEDAEEEDDEDDDEDGEGRAARRARKKKSAKASLLEHIEPAELEEGFLRDQDKRIQLEDRPERFQLRKVPVTETDTNELEYEARWIYDNAFNNRTISLQEDEADLANRERINLDPDATCSRILKALEFIRCDVFEVPFIAFYRKEYVEPQLALNDLWKVYQWDERWIQILQRRKHLRELFERMQKWQYEVIGQDPNAAMPDDIHLIDDETVEMVRQAETVENLADVSTYFDLYHGTHIHKLNEWERSKAIEEGLEAPPEPLKKPIRKDPYGMFVAAGLAGFAAKFGMTAAQYAENLSENHWVHEVEPYPVSPEETAQDYLNEQFDEPEKVIAAAKFMVAKEMSREPKLRSYLRNLFRVNALISTKVTKKGLKEIDENHPLFTRKYLRNKPVRELVKEEFLKLMQAETNGLIKIEIHTDSFTPDGQVEVSIVQDTIERGLYRRDDYSDTAKAWNGIRDETLEMALTKMLFPVFAKELRLKLIQEAKEYLVKECCLKLYTWLQVAAYQVDLTGADDEEEQLDALNGARVCGISYPESRDEAAFAVIVDGGGELIDHMRMCHLTKRKRGRPDHARLKEQDMTYFKNFIKRRKPHVIALAAENLDALFIKEDLEEAMNELETDEGVRRVPVEIIDNDLAKVYMNSKRAQTDFVEMPIRLREAISIARRLQDPLPEFCQMWTPDEEILCMKFHALQDLVPKDDLKDALMVEFINRVNEVGVDINKCLDHPHHSHMLQFACGLGPRKATMILKILRQNDNFLENRTKLVTLCKMGPKVFMNCAGFIKIDTSRLAEEQNIFLEILDGSRVHPETYEWARKMAIDALEIDDTTEDANPSTAVEEILRTPEKLKDLDLDAFAIELERQGFGNKKTTLYDIRAELNHRYKDLRTPYQSATGEDVFDLLTKETPVTFHVGKLIMGRVMYVVYRRPNEQDLQNGQNNPVRDEQTGFWQCPLCLKKDFSELSEVWTHFDNKDCPGHAVGVKVRLENGIMGFIPTKYISDKQVNNPEERVKKGMPVYCRVLKVDTDRFQAELSSRTSDLLDKDNHFRPQKDPYYNYQDEERDKLEEAETKTQKEKSQYVKRVIAHPNFRNVAFKEAEKILLDGDQGDAIVRPSSKGSNHLTVTWKVTDEVCAHIDVREEGKEKPFSLGKSLWIGEDEFEDLDEIIARHVQPMASFARDILNFKYFVEGILTKEEIEERLRDEKNRNSSRIPYLMTASKEYPGKFMLSYLPRTTIKHELLTVCPDGYRFRRQMHSTLPALMHWFKEHFREPPPARGQWVSNAITISGGVGGVSFRTPTLRTPTNNSVRRSPPFPSPSFSARPMSMCSPASSVAAPLSLYSPSHSIRSTDSNHVVHPDRPNLLSVVGDSTTERGFRENWIVSDNLTGSPNKPSAVTRTVAPRMYIPPQSAAAGPRHSEGHATPASSYNAAQTPGGGPHNFDAISRISATPGNYSGYNRGGAPQAGGSNYAGSQQDAFAPIDWGSGGNFAVPAPPSSVTGGASVRSTSVSRSKHGGSSGGRRHRGEYNGRNGRREEKRENE